MAGRQPMKLRLALLFVLVLATECYARTYTTNFPGTENPISEGDKWVNGKAHGINWQDVRTTTGLAFGTQNGLGGYDDSTALLTGSWGPDQNATATIHTDGTINGTPSTKFAEVEFRLNLIKCSTHYK